MTKTAGKQALGAASLRCWPCHILAVDPGQTSGFAVFRLGELDHADEVDIRPAGVAARIVELALRDALEDELPIFMVTESWGRGGPMGLAQWQGLGGAWQVWRWAAETVRVDGRRIPASRIIKVPVNTWRKAVLGRGNMKTVEAKAMAVRYVSAICGLTLGHNAAEAVCIGVWATRAAKVGERMPARARAKKRVAGEMGARN